MSRIKNILPPLTPPEGGEYLLNDYKDGSPFPVRGRAGDGVFSKLKLTNS
jgi:hypothetical protein